MKQLVRMVFIAALFLGALFVFPSHASAHCDTLDGPVITAAKKAMETDNANYILIWVKPEHEDEIRKALRRAIKKKKAAKTQAEKDKAEMELFETLVRIHREGEGAAYEGIKPARSVEPEIALADKAVKTGTVDEVLTHIRSSHNREIILHLFHTVKATSGYNTDDVSSGRKFIEAYVVFIHAVEKAMRGHDLDVHSLHEH